MTVPWVSAYILPSVSHIGTESLMLYLLSLAVFDDFVFSSPSLTPVNIATVEAAKAKGTLGCVDLVFVLCVFHF